MNAPRPRSRFALGLATLVVLLGLVAAACGGGSGSAHSASTTTESGRVRLIAPGGLGGVLARERRERRTSSTTTTVPPTTTTVPVAPYPVAQTTQTFVDTTRGQPARDGTPAQPSRTIRTTIWYPAATAATPDQPAPAVSAPGGFPLVVFAHGYAIDAASYSTLLHDIAMGGFVVAAPDFPGTSTAYPGEAVRDDSLQEPADISFVITSMLQLTQQPGPLHASTNPDAVGVNGQSDGGVVATAAGWNTCCRDARIKAGAIYTGATFAFDGEWFPPGSPPIMFVHATADEINGYSASTSMFERAQSPKYLLTIEGGSHLGAVRRSAVGAAGRGGDGRVLRPVPEGRPRGGPAARGRGQPTWVHAPTRLTGLAETLALLAALSFALGTTLQQRGALRTAAAEGDPHFLAELLHERVWWCGALLQACGWVLQALALDRGSIVAVQALCTLSLVFALPLGAVLTAQRVGRRSIAGALLTVVGITVFVGVGQPTSGVAHPAAAAWWTAAALAVAGMGVLASLAARLRGSVGAALFASAAGLAFAFQAAVTKEFVGVVGDGLHAILTSWTTWALVVSALAGFALQQSALKTGFLAPAMGASNAATLVGSVALGALVFEEHLVAAGNPAFPALVGLAVAVAGVVTLAVPDPRRGSARSQAPGPRVGSP